MTKYSTNNTSTSCCFSGIFKRFNCTGNLPTYPSPPDNQSHIEKTLNFHSLSNVVKSPVQAKANSPSIIARLMGLESLPNYEKSTTLDSLFRSKSLNALHFLPDFDPTRAAFHRRARTSASFHEQGNKMLIKIDENDGLLIKQSERKYDREKVVVLMEKSRESGSRIKVAGGNKKKYEECYTSNSSRTGRSRSLNNLREKCGMQKRKFVNNKETKVSSTVASKKKVGHTKVMCIEDKLVSVLHNHKELTTAPFRGNGRQIRRISAPKIKINDNLAQDNIVPKSTQNYEDRCSMIANKHELVKAEGKIANYFVEMLGYICKLAEEHTNETNWLASYELVKVHFVEELSLHLGQEILDLLLDELLHDITTFLL